MFTGSYFHTMDNKGRVKIPSRYLEIIEKDQDRHITITNWEGYILAFPQSRLDSLRRRTGQDADS